MARRKKRISEAELKGLIGQHISNAQGTDGGNLSKQREKSLEYYLSEKMGNEIEGRSQVVSSDVQDAVEPLMANLLRIFTSSNELWRCEPVGADDVEISEQATSYLNHVFFKKNNGWLILHNFIKDALIEKNGILKVFYYESDKVEREEYERLSDDEFTLLVEDDDVEVIEHTAYDDPNPTGGYGSPENPMAQDMQPPMVQPPMDAMPPEMASMEEMPEGEEPSEFEKPKLHDVVIHRIYKKGKCCVEGIPPEEFIIESRAKTIDEANFCAHRTTKTRGELIELGYDADLVETLPTQNTQVYNTETTARHRDIENGIGYDTNDYATQEVDVYECYIRCDYEGDGRAILRKVTVGGENAGIVLDDEPYDTMPFVSMTPIILPHRFYGRSVAELVEDVQLVKTFVLRALNDNIYGINNNRLIVNDSVTNLSDILTNRPNMVVRVKGSPQEAVQSMPVQSIGDTAYPLLEYFDSLKEIRTGVTKVGQGLDADALKSRTASGVNQVMTQAQGRMEFFARTFSNTGINDLGRKILECVIKHQDKEDIVRVHGEFVPFKPYEWKDRCDITVTSGLGTGNSAERITMLNSILERQIQAMEIQGNPDAPIVNIQKIYTTLQRIVETAGLKDVDQFFMNPMQGQREMPEEEPKEPSEFEKVSMAQIEGENQRKVLDLEQKAKESELRHKEKLLEFETKIRDLELKYKTQIDQEQIKKDTKLTSDAIKLEAQTRQANSPQPPSMPVNAPRPEPMEMTDVNAPPMPVPNLPPDMPTE